MTPPALYRLVRRCLAKDPDDRWQTARDLTIELKWIAEGGDGISVAGALPFMARKKRWRLVIGAAAVAAGAIAVTALVTQSLTRPKSEGAAVVFSIPAPEATQWTLGFSLSPDGRTLAFGDHDATGFRIYLRPLGSQVTRVLEGTEHAFMPFWSPDSSYLGFFVAKQLRKIKASGGRAETICEAVNGIGGTWNGEGVILFAPATDSPLYRVPADGGQPTRVTALDVSRHEIAHRYPFFLPDGRHFLYTVAPSHDGEFDCYVGSLDSPDRKLLLSASGAVVYAAPGYLVFRRNRSLMAQRFDARRLQLEGEPTPIPGVVTGTYSGFGEPTAFAADDGVLAWLNSPPPNTELGWLDRRGIRVGTVDAPPGRYEEVAVAPDNRRMAVTRMDPTGNRDIWIVDPVRGASRLTFDPDTDSGPIWSRDGQRIYFISWRSGVGVIYWKPVDGSQPEEILYKPTEVWASPNSESPDGRFLAFTMPSRGTGTSYWLLPLSGPRIPVHYLEVPTDGVGFDISPDGHWTAYYSSESGTNEAYVQSFPTPGRKFQISSEGGIGPSWANGGREIQYIVPPDKIMAMDVQTSPTFQAGKPHLLFRLNKDWGIYGVPDGQRFVVSAPTSEAPASTYGIMLNWTTALK